MPRHPRSAIAGCVYHVHNRGNNRAVVFQDDVDRLAFLDAIARANERYSFGLLGYCLMPDHFHLLVKPGPGASISRIIQSLTVAHTWHSHRRHGTTGHVWEGRFRGSVVQEDAHVLVALRYVESNPLRARLVKGAANYRWSSYHFHGLGEADALLSPFATWDELGRTDGERRRRWRERIRTAQKPAEIAEIRSALERARPYGDPEWTAAMCRRLHIPLVPRPRGRPRKEA